MAYKIEYPKLFAVSSGNARESAHRAQTAHDSQQNSLAMSLSGGNGTITVPTFYTAGDLVGPNNANSLALGGVSNLVMTQSRAGGDISLYDNTINPNSPTKHGGCNVSHKRKSHKRKSHKRKSHKRKSHKRKSHKRKSHKRKSHKRKSHKRI